MTQQEAWECDGCHKLYHFPAEQRFRVTIKRYDKEEAELTWDLCVPCHDKLMDFLEAKEEEASD